MRIRVDLAAVRENAREVQRMVEGDVVGVVKGVGARRRIVDAFLEAGIDAIAVSRVEHLRRLRGVDAELVMLRIPARSEIPDVVSRADLALHGSPTVARAAHREARRRGTTHRVVPMIGAGSEREGVRLDDAEEFLDALGRFDGVEVVDVGVNMGCFRDAVDPAPVRRLAERLPDHTLSVGGSGMLPIREELPDAVSSYRIGDAVLTGKFFSRPIGGLRRGAIELQGEVLASRPSESVVDVGSVNSDPRGLIPKGEFVIDRWTTEQMVIRPSVPEGELVPFEMEYDAIAATFNSRYVSAESITYVS